jgi:hypothetical protein
MDPVIQKKLMRVKNYPENPVYPVQFKNNIIESIPNL